MTTLITASYFLWQRKEAHKWYWIVTRLSCFNNKTDNSALIEKTKGILFSSTFKVMRILKMQDISTKFAIWNWVSWWCDQTKQKYNYRTLSGNLSIWYGLAVRLFCWGLKLFTRLINIRSQPNYFEVVLFLLPNSAKLSWAELAIRSIFDQQTMIL